jgi:YVTN family beta-propeller protein
VSRETSPAIGRELGGYRIEAVLGRGGMGVVYRATDARLGRKVALKVLPAERDDDDTFRARFLRESRTAASIDHPHVIPIYEAGEADGQLYIAMRHVEGTDLAQLLRAEGALDPERALALTGQLASALDAAHARGLVHRDVKPSNALVTRTADGEHVYLCDFGLSKEAAGDATLSVSGGPVGTVMYTAPEVLRSGHATPRSDVYSLGCVLFECLTGTPPFEGPTPAAVIFGHLEESPPRVTARRPGLPRALDAVLVRALDKDSEQRWASGAELMEAARAAAGGTAPAAPRPRRAARLLPRQLGRHRRGLGAGLAALAAAAVAAAAIIETGAGPDLATVKANGVAVIDPREGSLAHQVALEGAPAAIAAGAGAVWITDEERGVVSRIDTETYTIRQTIPVGHGPGAIAVGREGVWVANRQDGTLSVISPQTNQVVKRIRVGRAVDGVCISGGTVWVATPLDYAVVRYDARTARREGVVRLDDQPAALACGDGVVWASSPTSGTVTEISAATSSPVRPIQASRGITTVAVGAGGVWVTNPQDGTVSRIDPRRGAVTATIALGATDGPAQLAVTPETVWVSSEFGGTVARIDASRAQIVEKLTVGNRPQGLAVVDGALWIGIADTGTRHRGGTLRLEYGLELQDLRESWQLLALAYDGLTAFRREGSFVGATIVPDLAETLPAPTDGGRTYAFRLRRGIVYSDGKPVLPSHIRFGVEAAIRSGMVVGTFDRIRGAAGCTPKRCDLSRGIVANDAAGTVVFRLTEPDPDLLSKLALPVVSAVPPSAIAAWPDKPPPATGPYMITEFRPGRSIRLERNPRFRSWSATARPDGYPDVITARTGVERAGAIDRILAGRVDLISNLDIAVPPAQLAAARRRAPAQVRSSVAPVTAFFMFNTARAPFDDVDARRAVAHAFDRRAAVQAIGGPDVAQETCQVLPANFPGHRPYCPYTTGGSGAATGRPDLATARRLVRRSGTTGMRVTVQVPDRLPAGIGGVMVRTLRKLGYEVTLRRLSVRRHYATMSERDHAHVGFFPWLADYPSPSTFFALFSCDAFKRDPAANQNPSRFCDRTLDRLASDAARLQTIDPGAADALWARAEHRLVNQAPAVAMYNLLNVDLISARVGNYRFVPLLGVLLDQAWVR